MKSKLIIIMSALVLVMNQGMVFAHEGHDHNADNEDSMMMEDESMMKDQGMMPAEGKEDEIKAVEVGNKICPVSGNKIPAPGEKGEMGEAVQYEYNGKIYNLCCEMCIKDFKKDPEKYSKIAEEEVKKAQEESSMEDGDQ